jgi:hypothetical protein
MTEPRNPESDEQAAEAAADLDQEALDAAALEAETIEDVAEFGGELEDADEDEEDEEEAPYAPEARPSKGTRAARSAAEPAGPRGRRSPAARSAIPVDPSLRIHDRASIWFVYASIAVFVLILANAMLFGTGGTFTPLATPTPQPTVSATPFFPTGTPTAAPSVTGTAAPTDTPAPSAS